MNVILQGDGSPFGVLEVDSRTDGEFGEYDVAFLQGAANILGMAIEQQQYQRKLQALAVLETVEAERCTALYGVPTMFIAELSHPELIREPFPLSAA